MAAAAEVAGSRLRPRAHDALRRIERRASLEGMSLADVVAGNVRAEIARRQIPKDDVARAIGKSRATLAAKLAGRRAFDVEEVAVLAGLFGVAVETLLADPWAPPDPEPDGPPPAHAAAVAAA